MDTVGPPLKNTEVKIAEDGEILVRGPLVMKGYWRNKAETAPGHQGWLAAHRRHRTHRRSRTDCQITDRKKDLIVNDKGDNIAPQKIEGMLTLQPEILQAMVSGRQAAVHRWAYRSRSRMGAGMGRAQDMKYDFNALQDNPQLSRCGSCCRRPGQCRCVGNRKGPPVRICR